MRERVNRMDNFVVKTRNILDKIMRVFNVAVFSLLTLLTTWQVLTRYLFNNPSTWSEELASYMFAWITLLGAAYVFGKRDHMDIPIIVDLFNDKVRKVLAVMSEVIIFIFAVVILIYGGIEITSLTMGQMSSSLPLAMGYFYASVPISGVFTAIYCLLNIYDLVVGRISVSSDDEEELTAEEHQA